MADLYLTYFRQLHLSTEGTLVPECFRIRGTEALDRGMATGATLTPMDVAELYP